MITNYPHIIKLTSLTNILYSPAIFNESRRILETESKSKASHFSSVSTSTAQRVDEIFTATVIDEFAL